MSTYTIKLINSAMVDNNEYTSLNKAIDAGKFASNMRGCDVIVTRDDGVDIALIHHRYIDVNNKLHKVRVERLDD